MEAAQSKLLADISDANILKQQVSDLQNALKSSENDLKVRFEEQNRSLNLLHMNILNCCARNRVSILI